jgi:hypothetical protein
MQYLDAFGKPLIEKNVVINKMDSLAFFFCREPDVQEAEAAEVRT